MRVAGMVSRQIDARIEISRERPNDCLLRFLNYPPKTGTTAPPQCFFESPFPANPDFWLRDVDLSCASPWNDSYGRFRAGTAISKRHIVFAKHYPLAVGTRIAFVGTTGDVSYYFVKAVKGIASCDIMLGLLNYELTPDIIPSKILPKDFTNYVGRLEGLPVVTLTQDEKATLAELIATDSSNDHGLVSFSPSKQLHRSKYNIKIQSGDSGSPTFIVVGTRPILLFCLTTAMGGYPYHCFAKEVQRTMDDLFPGYKLETFDFSSAK